MAEVIPFKGVLYNPQKVDTSSVMAPPYDIVTPEFKEVLYGRSPYNIIRIDFGMDNEGDTEKENRYTRASKSLNNWLEQEILIKDSEPSFYCYETSYRINGYEKRLRGFLGAVRLEELDSGRIHPHEMTYSKPRADRLNIIRSCMANISPIFSLYSSPERLSSNILEKITKKKAFIEAKNGDSFTHRLWKISDKTSIEAIKKELFNKDIFIADGHHRYETALEFRDKMDKVRSQGSGVRGQDSEVKPWDYVMMFLVNMEDEGLAILPTHRLSRTGKEIKIKEALKPYFDITTVNPVAGRTGFDGIEDKEAIQEMFKSMQKCENSRNPALPTLGMFIKNEKKFYILNCRDSGTEINSHKSLKFLDVTILHKLIFEKLLGVDKFEYEIDPELAVEKVKNGPFQAAFFLNSTKIHDVKKVALAGQRMPPKATYFYPKLLTGMVIYKF
ncbi:MAG: DUF1015 domain-containing protein [Thermodesulfovibrionia bacterium]